MNLYILKKLNYLMLFVLWDACTFISACEKNEYEEKKPIVNSFKIPNYSADATRFYQKALKYSETDSSKFKKYLKKATYEGHLEATCTLGTYYHLTEGRKEKALKWYNFASEKGHKESQKHLENLKKEIKAKVLKKAGKKIS